MLNKLIKSFYYASEGIRYTLSSQRNMKIHVAISQFVLLLGMWLHFDLRDIFIILILMGAVLSAEMVNTAVETVVDLITSKYAPLAKIAKDVAAGAVLILAIIALLIGLFIIFPYLQKFYIKGSISEATLSGFYIQASFFLILLTYIVKSYWGDKNAYKGPHVLFGLLTLLFFSFIFENNVGLGLGYAITILIPYLIFLIKGEINGVGLLQNLFISGGGLFILHWLFF